MTLLQIVWFILVAVLLIGYTILDGFDLGAGFWSLFSRDSKERGAIMKSIGPFWDGNEVWLLTGGGAIFAAFPPVYATVFSGFYMALMLVLLALIFRAVSLEFRHHLESERWRRAWDIAFGLGSTLPALLLGVALGNVMRGLPMNANGDYTGGFFGLLNPFALLVGLTGLAMFLTHGALFLLLKVESVKDRAPGWAKMGLWAWATLFVIVTIAAFATQPHLTANFNASPALYVIPLLAAGAFAALHRFLSRGLAGRAFIASSIAILLMWTIVAAALFPTMVPAREGVALTIANASSGENTLFAMFIIALLGMPVVLGYTIWIYRTFRGTVEAHEGGY